MKSVHWNYMEVINMEIYKNSYTENEDFLLWEIHEIRHKLHSEIAKKGIDEINLESRKIIENWKNRKEETTKSA